MVSGGEESTAVSTNTVGAVVGVGTAVWVGQGVGKATAGVEGMALPTAAGWLVGVGGGGAGSGDVGGERNGRSSTGKRSAATKKDQIPHRCFRRCIRVYHHENKVLRKFSGFTAHDA